MSPKRREGGFSTRRGMRHGVKWGERIQFILATISNSNGGLVRLPVNSDVR
jgi:hypothetical protein